MLVVGIIEIIMTVKLHENYIFFVFVNRNEFLFFANWKLRTFRYKLKYSFAL